MNMKDKVKSITSRKEKGVILLTIDSSNYLDTNTKMVKALANSGLRGVYVTLNYPYGYLKKKLAESGVKVENIHFVDMITKASGIQTEKKEDCTFIDNPAGLTDLGIVLAGLLPGKDFLFLDSLSTMLLRNESRSVEKFSQFLSARVRAYGVKAVFVSLKRKEDEDIIKTVSQFADEVILV